MERVKHYLTKFDFAASLLDAITLNSQSEACPPSPAIYGLSDLSDLTDLSDLSDLTDLSGASDAFDLPPVSPPTPLSPGNLPSNLPMSLTEMEGLVVGTSRGDGPKSRVEKIQARRRMRNRERRKKSRALQNQGLGSHHLAREGPRKKYVNAAIPLQCKLDTKQSKVTGAEYTGGDRRGSKKLSTLSELLGKGFKLIAWQGEPDTTQAILDKSRRIIGILAGHPRTEDWPNVHAQAAEEIEAQRSKLHLPKKMRKHRRGNFPALACGVSHGGGQRRPSNLDHHPKNRSALDYLNSLRPIQRIAGFASSVMATWAPQLHAYYASAVNSLHANDPSLHRLFLSGIFSAASYNFGPRTICFKHKDFANLPFGLCAITALGSFDPTKGGHLILWDLELVIEFPPGSTILLPSAIIAHSNTNIGKDESRYSFTQYTAGALFHWVDNQFTTQESYLSTLEPEELATEEARNKERWGFGLSLLPTMPDDVVVVEL